MFCSSLRKRPTWAHIVPVLLNDRTATWKETDLESHDIAFPVSRPGSPIRVFRIALLTARDVEMASSGLRRVAMLSHASGAKGAAVLFLLGDGALGWGAGPNAMEAFMKLQIEVATASPMALIPLASISDLYPTVQCLRNKLSQAPGTEATAGPEDAAGISTFISICLERQLTGDERAALHRIPVISVQDLARKVADPRGQCMLREHLSGVLLEKVIEFFARG